MRAKMSALEFLVLICRSWYRLILCENRDGRDRTELTAYTCTVNEPLYTATMIYPLRPEKVDEFARLWDTEVLELAKHQPGFVRMQLMTRESEAMAMGTWKSKSHAEAFMALGVFQSLMSASEDFLTGSPKPTIWSLVAFASA